MKTPKSKRGGENIADSKRAGGPRVHGHDWEGGGATSNGTRGTKLTQSGTRGAVFGHGGKGKVQRARKATRNPGHRKGS